MKKQAIWVCGALLCAASAAGQTAPKTHEIKATPATTFYRFLDPAQKPVLTVDSGDIVRLETATGTPGYFQKLGVPKDKIPQELFVAFAGIDDGARRDHQLTGPIYINGAAPGDMLEVRLRSIELRLPIAGQQVGPNGGALPGEFQAKERALFLDLKNKTVEYAPGVVVPLNKPFWGSISVAPPPSIGRVSDARPDVYGANMDNADLVQGTTLYLPVFNPGALLAIGDGHAAQGDGEVGQSGIETSLKGEIQVILHKGKTIKLPRAETPAEYMTMGFHEDLDEAAKIAVREMVSWLVEMKGLSREDAYMISSATLDLHVTEVVDGNKGVHAVVPKSIFTK